jgi:hypothetical protein
MLYIIASSLDINNIVSTESISPSSFYPKRNFGHTRWESDKMIPALKHFKNRICLFSEIPSFTLVGAEGLLAFPMVIEIDESRIVNNNLETVVEHKGCKVFSSDDTIYLTPANCKFLFFSKEAKDKARLDLEDPLAKIADYFQMLVIPSDNKVSLEEILSCIKNDAHPKESNENTFDKIKGFVYGFCIGKALSLTKDLAEMRRCQKRIYDLKVAIERGAPYLTYKSQIDELIITFKKHHPCYTNLWPKYEEEFKDIKERIKQNCNTESKNYYTDMFMGYAENKGYPVPVTYNNIQADEQVITSETKKHIDKYRKDLIKSFNVAKLLMYQDGDCSVIDDSENLYNDLYNEILNKIVMPQDGIESLTKLKTNRFDITTDILFKIKDIYGQKWKDSPESIYLNSLRKFISDNRNVFKICETDDIVLKSLAAFIWKGDDLEELIKLLENESIHTYQYALGMWGALNGYVQLRRATIENVFPSKEFEQLYKDCHKLLLGKDYDGELKKSISSEKTGDKQPEATSTLPSQINNNPNAMQTNPTKVSSSFVDEIMSIFENMDLPEKIKKDNHKENIRKAATDSKEDYSIFINKLDECNVIKTIKEGFVKLFSLDNSLDNSKMRKNSFDDNREIESIASILNKEEEVIEIICRYVSPDKHDEIQNDIKWLFDTIKNNGYSPNGKNYDTYKGCKYSPEKIITKIQIFKRANNNGKQWDEFLTQENRNKIKEELTEKFGHEQIPY